MNLRTIEELLFPEAAFTGAAPAESARVTGGQGRSPFERFAIPHVFQPSLSPSEAVRATLRTFLRVFLGSVLFGVWGAYTLLLWTKIPNPFLRVAAMIPMVVLFLALLCGLLIATTLVIGPRSRGRA